MCYHFLGLGAAHVVATLAHLMLCAALLEVSYHPPNPDSFGSSFALHNIRSHPLLAQFEP